MMRTRLVFLTTSVMVVVLFTGMIVASRETKEDLFKALGNLAEVIHLVRNEYVDELNTEALQLSLDAGIVESVDQAAAVLPESEVEAYQSLNESPPPFGLVLADGHLYVQHARDKIGMRRQLRLLIRHAMHHMRRSTRWHHYVVQLRIRKIRYGGKIMVPKSL